MTKLSKHFTLEELIRSDTASRLEINNTPSDKQLEHANKYLIPGLEQVRELLGNPILISSGFRSLSLNMAVPGSSSTSQHCKFEAADFTCPGFGSVLDVAKKIMYSSISFDQLIYEYGSWVHLSFSKTPRKKVLSKYKATPYLTGLVDRNNKPL
jgi:zinc D-Ala-D-Ala carboxypeptidase